MSTFRPYRKPPPPPPPTAAERVAAEELAAITRLIATQLERVAYAMDIHPAGAITLRDEFGQVWEITVQRSDAPRLRCEVDLETVTKP